MINFLIENFCTKSCVMSRGWCPSRVMCVFRLSLRPVSSVVCVYSLSLSHAHGWDRLSHGGVERGGWTGFWCRVYPQQTREEGKKTHPRPRTFNVIEIPRRVIIIACFISTGQTGVSGEVEGMVVQVSEIWDTHCLHCVCVYVCPYLCVCM